MSGGGCQHPWPHLSHLFEEENRKAQELLEAAAQRQGAAAAEVGQQLQQKRQRWKVGALSPKSPRGGGLRESLPPSRLCLLVHLRSYPSPPPHPSYPLPHFLSRLKEELEKLGIQVPAQAQSKQEEEAGLGEAVSPGNLVQERELVRGAVGGKAPQKMVLREGHFQWNPSQAKVQQLAVWGEEGQDPWRVWAQGSEETPPKPDPTGQSQAAESVRRKTQSHPPSSTRCPEARRTHPALELMA